MSEDIENDDSNDVAFVRALTEVQKAVGHEVSTQHYNKNTPYELLERPPQAGDSIWESVKAMAPIFENIGQFWTGVAADVGVNADGLVTSSQISSGAEDLNSAVGSNWSESTGDTSGAGGKH